jgi:hypothetical protein
MVALSTRPDARSPSFLWNSLIARLVSGLNLEQSLVAMVKHRYGKQSLVDGVWVDVWP